MEGRLGKSQEAAQMQGGRTLGTSPSSRVPVAKGDWSPWAGAGKKSWLPLRVPPALGCWMVGLEGEAGVPELLCRLWLKDGFVQTKATLGIPG